MKKFIAILCCIFLITTSILFICCDKKNNEEKTATSFVVLDINPSVEFVVDNNNKVLSIHANNEDAEVMLYDEKGLLDVDISTSVDKVVSLAYKYGYLNEENSTINVSISADKKETENCVKNLIETKLNASLNELEFDASISFEDTFDIQRKLKQYKEDYPDLTPSKLRLILAAMSQDSSLTFKNAYNMKNAELLQIIQDGYLKYEDFYTKAYEQQLKLKESIYNNSLDIAKAGVYVQKFTKFYPPISIENDKKLLISTNYVACVSARYAVYNALLVSMEIDKYEVNNAIVEDIANKLEINVDDLKNKDDKITLISIESYISKLLKNASDLKKEELKDDLNNIMDMLNEEEEKITSEENQAYITAINSAKTLLDGISNILNIDINLDFSQDKIRETIYNIEQKEASLLKQMNDSLTDDQKNEIKKAQDDAEKTLSSQREAFDKEIAKIKENVKAELQAKKDALIAQDSEK